jgi:hypothetical protein
MTNMTCFSKNNGAESVYFRLFPGFSRKISYISDAGLGILHVVIGTPAGTKWERRVKELAGEGTLVKCGAQADIFYLYQLLQTRFRPASMQENGQH